MNAISEEVRIGTVGELLVALRLLQYGVQAAPPVKDSGNDLIAVKGEVFRAIQVKTTQSPAFNLSGLHEKLFHIVALVSLVGIDHSIYLDQSRIFLLEKNQINRSVYRIEDLSEYQMDAHRVNMLFGVTPLMEAQPASSIRAAAQQLIQPERE